MQEGLSYLFNTSLGNLLVISFLHLSAWIYCLTLKSWVSDDIEGIAKFSDRFLQTRDKNGIFLKEETIKSYQQETGEKDKDGKPVTVEIRNTQFNKYLGFPASIMRWIRLNYGKKFVKLGVNKDNHPIYGYSQSVVKHHLLNILSQWIVLVLLYNFLTPLIGTKLSFLSTLIFCLHPCLVQCVGWISGINYVFSLIGTLTTLNVVQNFDNPIIVYPAIVLSTTFSAMTLLPGCFTFVILLFLGFWKEAAVVGMIGLYILLKIGKWTVNYRIKAFKDQNMQKSTFITFRKPIVMIKTFWYYIKLIVWPKRLGLFHTWGYHFDEPIEKVDREFWFGLISIGIVCSLFLFFQFPLKFAVLWYFTYLVIFSNFITAQQFVSERYVYTSLVGFSIILAYFIQDYPVLIAFILGIYIMRIWIHLPTYKNEVRFYESNCFNFPDSEVAMGNLGVSYLNHGYHHKAYDQWLEATRQNSTYDVPWYNLYSLTKQNGDIINARNFLSECLKAKIIHFREQWEKELKEIDAIIAQAVSDGKIKVVQQPK